MVVSAFVATVALNSRQTKALRDVVFCLRADLVQTAEFEDRSLWSGGAGLESKPEHASSRLTVAKTELVRNVSCMGSHFVIFREINSKPHA